MLHKKIIVDFTRVFLLRVVIPADSITLYVHSTTRRLWLTDVNSQQTRRAAVLEYPPLLSIEMCYYPGTRLASRPAKNDAHGVPSGTQ